MQYKQSGIYNQSKHKNKRKPNGTLTGDKGTESSIKNLHIDHKQPIWTWETDVGYIGRYMPTLE